VAQFSVGVNTASLQLVADIRRLIEQSRQQLASAVNSALTLLYWHIGQRIRNEVLHGERATYGEQIVSALSRQLALEWLDTTIEVIGLNRLGRLNQRRADV
jgi:DUF1016 N-terminal domain